MPQTLRPVGRVLLVLATAGALTLGTATAITPDRLPGSGSPPAAVPSQVDGAANTVTLISGDRVTLSPDGKQVTVARGAGRAGIRFVSSTVGAERYVLPEDAVLPVTRGVIDPRLFDVNRLVRLKYDDASRRDLPVRVTAAAADLGEARAFSAARGAETSTLRQDKSTTAAFWAGAARRLGKPGGIARIELDAPGAPAAAGIAPATGTDTVTLTVRHVGGNGRPTGDAESAVFGLGTPGVERRTSADGTVTFRLPRGDYMLVTDIVRFGDARSRWNRLVQPKISLTADTTVVADARTARRVVTTVPRREARTALVELGLEHRAPSGEFITESLNVPDFRGLFSAQIGASVPAEQMTSYVGSVWAVPGRQGNFADTPYTYQLLDAHQGGFPTGFRRAARDAGLATVHTQHNAQSPSRRASKSLFGTTTGVSGTQGVLIPYSLPSRVVHRVEAGGASWSGAFGENVPGPGGIPSEVTLVGQAYQTYEAGKRYSVRWNAATYGPLFDYAQHAGRIGDTLWFGIPMYSDQDGHRGGSLTDSGSTKLYRNGELVGRSGPGQLQVEVPAGEASYRVTKSLTRPSVSSYSTRTDATWTFRSGTAPAGGVSLPLWVVRFMPTVDEYNRARRTPVTTVPFLIQSQPDATVGTPTELRVEASGDGGRTWQPATVAPAAGENAYTARFRTPAGGDSVALRAYLADSHGNTVQERILGAYRYAKGTAGAHPTPGPAASPSSCVQSPSRPTLSRTGHIRISTVNDCDIYAIFWLMRFGAADQSGWRTITERWVPPRSPSTIDHICRGSGTHTYKAVMFDPNMMGYFASDPVRITC